MPLFEVEHNGKRYQVDAANAEAAAQAFEPGPDLDAMTQRFAQESERARGKRELEMNTQLAKDAGAGMMEGGRQLKAGVKQLGADVSDAWGLIYEGKPFDYDRVTRDKTGQIIKRETGKLDSSNSLPVIADELMRQQIQTEVDRDRGVNIDARNTAAGATQIGALTLGPELAAPRATTLTGAMLKNAGTGTAGSALSFDAEGNKGTDAAIAAASGPVLATVTGLVPATKNMIGRALRRVAEGTRTGNARASAEEVLGKDFGFSLAQRTGVPELVTLERRAYNTDMQNFMADQTDKFIDRAVKALQQPLKPGQSIENDFTAARELADRELKGLKLHASNSYEAGIKQAKDMASRVTMGPGGTLAPVPTPKFGEQVSAVLDQARGMSKRGLQNPLPEKYMRNLEKVASGGQVTPKDLADVLQDLTLLQKDTTNPVGQALASRMRGALDNDLDELDKLRDVPGGARLDDSVTRILDTRAEYRRAMTAARELSESAAYKLLGVGEEGADASELLGKLKGMNPQKRDSVRRFMEANSPDLLVSMKDAAVKDALARAGTIRPAADSQQTLENFADALFDPKGADLRTSGIWNADELKKLESIKNGMRTIANNRPVMGGAGTPITPEDTAINIISQHAAFVSRYLTRVLMSQNGAKFFTDPNIYARMNKINRTTTGSPSNMIARAALLDYLQTDYTEDGQTLEPAQ